jgi:hypothetical protein
MLCVCRWEMTKKGHLEVVLTYLGKLPVTPRKWGTKEGLYLWMGEIMENIRECRANRHEKMAWRYFAQESQRYLLIFWNFFWYRNYSFVFRFRVVDIWTINMLWAIFESQSHRISWDRKIGVWVNAKLSRVLCVFWEN